MDEVSETVPEAEVPEPAEPALPAPEASEEAAADISPEAALPLSVADVEPKEASLPLKEPPEAAAAVSEAWAVV